MNISEVQQYAYDRIMANATLAAMSTPIIFSHFTKDDDAREAIAGKIRSDGVCFEISSVEADGESTKPNNRYNLVDAKFTVYVAESPISAHTPRETELAQLVATAVQKRVDAYQQNPRCVRFDSAVHELGYVLHALTFTVPAIIP